jgi:hypothetical protein
VVTGEEGELLQKLYNYYLTPRISPESVRCDWNGISLHLKLKPK